MCMFACASAVYLFVSVSGQIIIGIHVCVCLFHIS